MPLDSSETQLIEIVVEDADRKKHIKKEEVNRVESIDKDSIAEKKATTFAQAIDDEKGVDTQTSCAFCGAKRVSINGLKGEHTTILIDGVPLHSTVSGFYGIEAIPLDGIESIDIYRGSGAALSAPESIGGALNILTVDPFVPVQKFKILYGDDQSGSINLSGSKKISDQSAIFLGTQISENQNIDQDQNFVTEKPHQKNFNFFSKLKIYLENLDELNFKWSYGKLTSYGGNPNDLRLDRPVSLTAQSSDFENNDVRKKFIGAPEKITDNIELERQELTLSYTKDISTDSKIKFNLAGAWQKQEAIYSHGYDYNNNDAVQFFGSEFQKIYSNHLIYTGIDYKKQTMTSTSDYLYRQMGLAKDNLTHSNLGLFVQDTWNIRDDHELSLALRFDHIQVNWLDLQNNLDRTMIAPRFYYKYIHNSIFTSRVGLGIGYRSPLTLFESQHGTDHNGFMINIKELETAESFLYSLLAQDEKNSFEVSTHLTKLKNMAYGIDQASTSQPTIFTNSTEDYLISVYDISYARKFSDFYKVEGVFEMMNYPNSYKIKLPVAATEKKFSLKSTYDNSVWNFQQKVNVIFEQDLSAYGYDQHYNIAYVDTDIMSPTFDQSVYLDQKRQDSPTYMTLDLSVKKNIHKYWDLEIEIKNVFDYTQTKAGDSPLTWAKHGSHFHLDNFHLWGPNQGRQFFISILGEF